MEDLPDALYSVVYCDVFYEDVLDVFEGEGAVQFRSPESAGKLLLIEDPRDCAIDVLQGETVILTSGDRVLGEKVTGPKDTDDADKIEVEVDLESTDVIAGAKGEAEYEVEGDESEFSVQIQGVPVGDRRPGPVTRRLLERVRAAMNPKARLTSKVNSKPGSER